MTRNYLQFLSRNEENRKVKRLSKKTIKIQEAKLKSSEEIYLNKILIKFLKSNIIPLLCKFTQK